MEYNPALSFLSKQVGSWDIFFQWCCCYKLYSFFLTVMLIAFYLSYSVAQHRAVWCFEMLSVPDPCDWNGGITLFRCLTPCEASAQRNPCAAKALESLKSSKATPLPDSFSITGFILTAHISKKLKSISHLQNMEYFLLHNWKVHRELLQRGEKEKLPRKSEWMALLFYMALSGDNSSIPGCIS